MKVVIFAGGFGTRITEESHLKPKPMIEIGDKPILWHIMKVFEAQGFNDFIICLGYKGYLIKEYFLNYYIYNSDITVNLKTNSFEVHCTYCEKFRVTLVDTGLYTGTAGRLKRIRDYVNNGDFLLTYGDGLSDVSLKDLINYHRQHGKVATMTAVQPEGRFGVLTLDDDNNVNSFKEKPLGDGGWVNGGFFVLKSDVFSLLPDDADKYMFEECVLERLAKESNLMAYKHKGFWKCMDTLRDKLELERLWNSGNAPWKIWN